MVLRKLVLMDFEKHLTCVCIRGRFSKRDQITSSLPKKQNGVHVNICRMLIVSGHSFALFIDDIGADSSEYEH